MTTQLTSLCTLAALFLMVSGAAHGQEPSKAELDRTVLPTQAPVYPAITEMNARKAEDEKLTPAEAEDAGLVTAVLDDIDYEDEVRVAVEERASLSPDALTGMEASLRFPGSENCDSKIFGRLSAWQNWIFQRPNAVGAKGALTLYGKPERPEFDPRRT